MTATGKRQEFLSRGSSKTEEKVSFFRKRIRLISSLRVILALAIIIGFYQYLKVNEAWLIYLITFLIISFIILVRFYFNLKDKLSLERSLLGEYKMELDYLKGNLPDLDFKEVIDLKDHPFAQDLNLFGKRSLFHHLNRSFSIEGQTLIQKDIANQEALENVEDRQKSLSELSLESEFNLKYRSLGRGIKETPLQVHALIDIWRKEPLKKLPIFITVLMWLGKIFTLYALVNFTLDPSVGSFKVLNYAFIINLVITFSQFKSLRKQQFLVSKLTDSIERYVRLISYLETQSFKSKVLQDQLDKLGTSVKSSQALAKLSGILNSLEQMANVFVLIFLNGLFHYHLHRLNSLAHWKLKYAGDLSKWIEVTTQFEMYTSYATYIENHPSFSWPNQTERPNLEASEISHPLIPAQQRVSNSFSFKEFKQMILTGSNMSGKSTFLRTVGLNLVLAKRGLPVAANNFVFYPFQILCSMNPSDNIHENTSYFQAEVIRLKALLDAINQEKTSLMLLDEILRGTNSEDKKEGSRLFLKKIAALNCLGVIATHDIDISKLSESEADIFAAYYFESTVKGNELIFDYKLRKGVCLTPNATSLLRNYGII